MSYDLLFFRVKKGGDLQDALKLFGAVDEDDDLAEGDDDELSDDDDEDEEEGDDAGDEDDAEIDPAKLPFDISLEDSEILLHLAVPYLSGMVPPEERSIELMKWLKAATETPRKAKDLQSLPDEVQEQLEFMAMNTPGVYMLDVGGGEELAPRLLAVCSALKALAARGIYVLDPQLGMLMPDDPEHEYYDIDEDADDGFEDDDDDED